MAEAVGRELPNEDIIEDYDPTTNEHADTDLKELERIVDKDLIDSGMANGDPDFGEQLTLQEPEPPQEQEEAAPADEPRQPEETSEPEQEQEAAEAPAEEEQGDPMQELLDLQSQQMDMQREKMAAESERWKYLAQARQTEIENLRRTPERPSVPQTDDYGDPSVSHTDPRFDSLSQEVRALREDQMHDALRSAATDFQTSLGTVEVVDESGKPIEMDEWEAYSDELQPILASEEFKGEVQLAYNSGNAKFGRRVLQNAMKAALADAKLTYLQSRAEEARQRAFANTEARTAAKREASVQGSETSVPEQPDPSRQDPRRMKISDLEALINKEHGVEDAPNLMRDIFDD